MIKVLHMFFVISQLLMRRLEKSKPPDNEARETSQGTERQKDMQIEDDEEDEEIDPLDETKPTRKLADLPDRSVKDMTPEAQEQIRNLAIALQKSRVQENRLAGFAFEPVSMPPSRVSSTT